MPKSQRVWVSFIWKVEWQKEADRKKRSMIVTTWEPGVLQLCVLGSPSADLTAASAGSWISQDLSHHFDMECCLCEIVASSALPILIPDFFLIKVRRTPTGTTREQEGDFQGAVKKYMARPRKSITKIQPALFLPQRTGTSSRRTGPSQHPQSRADC